MALGNYGLQNIHTICRTRIPGIDGKGKAGGPCRLEKGIHGNGTNYLVEEAEEPIH